MESKYHYFKRDISWLSFNYRVLLEADDDSLPLYERINFISIYSSNLEEFYKIRVAEHKAIASGGQSDDMTQEEARHLIHQITEAVNSQMEDRIRIYEHKIVPALRRHHIIFYQSKQEVEPFHQEFISNFFKEEIFPYLQPVPVCKNRIKTFLRDNRLYLSVRVTRKDTGEEEYYIIKLPYSKVPRFIELPRQGENFYLMYMEDIIKANINRMFPGYILSQCVDLRFRNRILNLLILIVCRCVMVGHTKYLFRTQPSDSTFTQSGKSLRTSHFVTI